MAWCVGWVLIADAVAAGIALAGGPADEWTTVYLIERSLSLDNIFLFTLLLAYFAVPAELRGTVVLIGIAGALVLRAVAITSGLALIDAVDWVVYLFGVLLLYVAYRTFRGLADEIDPARGALGADRNPRSPPSLPREDRRSHPRLRRLEDPRRWPGWNQRPRVARGHRRVDRRRRRRLDRRGSRRSAAAGRGSPEAAPRCPPELARPRAAETGNA